MTLSHPVPSKHPTHEKNTKTKDQQANALQNSTESSRLANKKKKTIWKENDELETESPRGVGQIFAEFAFFQFMLKTAIFSLYT